MEPISTFIVGVLAVMLNMLATAGGIFCVAWILAFFCGVDLIPWVQGLST